MENNQHFFSKKEFQALFPAKVVDTMATVPKAGSDDLYYFRDSGGESRGHLQRAEKEQ